jgi:hypothetical protein
MNTANLPAGCYSADVRMELHVNGHVLPIGQLGPDFLILREAAEYPPTDAEISLSVDGRMRRWRVRLVDGIATERVRTRISGTL